MENKPQIYLDFLSYRDPYGMNQGSTQDKEDQITQNGTLFTTEYFICLMLNLGKEHPLVLEEAARIKEVFRSIEVADGLTVRFIGSTEFDSMDNYSAMLIFSALYGDSEFAKRVRHHGLNTRADGVDETQDYENNKKFYPLAFILNGFRAPRNFWNASNPTKFCMFSWFGRSPGFMGLIDICATGKTTWFRSFGLWVGQMLGLLKKRNDCDGWKLAFNIWQLLKDRSWIWKKSYELWCNKLLKQHPDGMNGVFKEYGWGHHPISKWSTKL